jgi:voltage-gated potassium channel
MKENVYSHYAAWWHVIFGHKTNPSTSGSNRRRYNSRLCLYLALILLANTIFSYWFGEANLDISVYAPVMLSANALWFFYWVILLPPFRHGAGVDATRLFIDTIISTFYMITVFALWYSVLGIKPHGYSALDTLYFSAVTFSTLGYGDFKPSPNAQAFAAIQAILGNLHLGMIVGATFAATQKDRS